MEKSRRLGWISSCLRFAGRLGPREKKILLAALDISEATMSRDQAAFFNMLPGNGGVRLEGGKLEVVDPAAFTSPDDLLEPSLDEWLQVMLGARYVSTVGIERGKPSSNTVRLILKAIQDQCAIFIRYASRSVPEPTWRPVSPHAVVNVAGRYHARCFDHLKGRYGDFVLNRILESTFDRNDLPSYVDGRLDNGWSQVMEVKISLKEGETSLVGSLDFGLDETQSRIIRVRKALAPYVVDHRHEGFEDPVEIKVVEQGRE